jgi:AcrR family transcriptional regulator
VLLVAARGLREVKRAETERRLASIAHDLVRERGFTQVTVDDIAELAHVSRRTFSNYYSCKEEAVAAVILHAAEDGLTTWRPDPTGSLADLVRSLVRHQAEAGVLARLVEVAGLVAAHRQLAPFVRDAQWHLWATAGERLPLRGDSPEPLRQAERDALLGAVFGVVSAQLAHTLPGTDAQGPHSDRLRHLVEHVIDRFEEPGRQGQ